MDIRKIRDNMGRIKVYYLKNDTMRALGSAITGLKALGNASPPMDVRGAIREGIQLLARDEEIKKYLKTPLIYQPGQEKALLVLLSKIYQQMEGLADQEEHDVALARKQKLDQYLVLGQKLLAQEKVSEADAAFQEALTYYKDEHRAYYMIGKFLIDAEQPRRAFPYLKKAVELEPDNAAAKGLLDIAFKAREEDPR